MSPLRTTLAYAEYLALLTADLLYALIPAYRAYDLAAGLARALFPLFRTRRAIAVENILKAGITADPLAADRLARRAFGHLAGHLCEALKAGAVIGPENWRDHIAFDGPEESWRLLFDTPQQPIMILTGHHGSWEVGACVISFSRPMIAVARKMNNPFVDRYLKRRHFRGNITIVPKKSGFSSGVLRLWAEQKAAMTIVMDQHAGPRHGLKIDFLGRPAGTHTSPARLHLKTRAPILAGSIIREGPFRYRMVTGLPIRFEPTGDRDADTTRLLTEINARLADVIRRYPEQYLWAHKRWR